MEIARYKQLKAKGVVSLMPVGKKGHFAVGITQHDPESGEELDPQLQRITREMVESAKKSFQEGVEACDELLADMDAMVPKA